MPLQYTNPAAATRLVPSGWRVGEPQRAVGGDDEVIRCSVPRAGHVRGVTAGADPLDAGRDRTVGRWVLGIQVGAREVDAAVLGDEEATVGAGRGGVGATPHDGDPFDTPVGQVNPFQRTVGDSGADQRVVTVTGSGAPDRTLGEADPGGDDLGFHAP